MRALKPNPKIFFSEISDQGNQLELTNATAWVQTVFQEFHQAKADQLPEIHVDLMFRKLDGFYSVTGKMRTQFQLICGRCADPFTFTMNYEFKMLYSQDPAYDESGTHVTDLRANASGGDTSLWDVTFTPNDFFQLDQLLNEQILLALPLNPICGEACQGICQECGGNLNQGPCPCPKGLKSTIFSKLLDLETQQTQWRR